MEPKTKKYLIYGGVGLAGVVLYYRWKHEDKTIKDAKKKAATKPKSLTPAQIAAQMPQPSTASQYSPVGFNPYPQAGYPPPYTPPYPVTGTYPPVGYPGGYPPVNGYPYTPVTGYPGSAYPVSGYPPVTGYPTSPYGVDCQAAAQAIIGLASGVAIQRLRTLGVQAQIVSRNGRALNVVPISYGGPVVLLYLTGNIVQSASCQGQYAIA